MSQLHPTFSKPINKTFKNNIKTLRVFALSMLVLLLINFIYDKTQLYFATPLAINPIDNENLVYKIVVGCLVAPILETFFFQVLPNIVLTNLKIRNDFLLIGLPAFFFGLDHYYNILYLLCAFFAGIIFNYLYITGKRNANNAFFYVFFLHCIYNCYAYLL
ncbi:hypothetical protein DHW03_08110 [Pedobacter yonginense]|uniref:CAAX prenyl protease 2/Lysostaphin resistance protein A-like domain-containing protein n=1 Tax=Pedobacter yonginense TaxID=651869 RepID=A0A317EN03_9SPHI|nr:CPBP family glutamic-type intramembrane protease [Pedobacter yonginense]PWS27547.1 hypothetical protein DHW03_08110 [Pedobacter yonginense]